MPENQRTGPPVSDDGMFWWNGQYWQPIGQRPPMPAKTGHGHVGQIVGGIVLAFVVIVAGLWIIGTFASANDGVECATHNVERSNEGLPALDCPE